mmetsp:Transcript_9291/g.21941  ORF Transcript_9291/g.21941 Transcript_9291/m.21941 type:complete len:344 (-) Transcript_9291:1604-2635(-)
MGTILVHAIFLFVASTSFALSARAFNAPSDVGGRSALSTGFNAPFGLGRCGSGVGVGVSADHKSLPPTFFMSASYDVSPPSTTDDETGSRGHVDILYCTGCRWMLRSAYYAQELLTSFQDDLTSVTLIPSASQSPGGMFFVSVEGQTIWNRKARGRFPETKELKQLVRDIVSPGRNLGHSDASNDIPKPDKCEKCGDDKYDYGELADFHIAKNSHVTIRYCIGCQWLLRAAWDAQELLTTFAGELSSVTLVPTHEPAGQFIVELDGKEIWDRAAEGRHAEPKELKRRIRDIISPNLDLGHSDVNNKAMGNEDGPKIDGSDDDSPFDELDDDEAAEMRGFYGVM